MRNGARAKGVHRECEETAAGLKAPSEAQGKPALHQKAKADPSSLRSS